MTTPCVIDAQQTLTLGGEILLANFVTPDRAADLMEKLLAEVEFDQYAITLFGKSFPQPRLVGWKSAFPYRYSGFTLSPRPVGGQSALLLSEVNHFLSQVVPGAPAFNHILFNLYRDGQDSMGFHSDDEPELGSAPLIGSLSLGQERTFVVTPKKRYAKHQEVRERFQLPLKSGSLLFMLPPMQRYYLHGLPKTSGLVQPRLNLTFRHILPSSQAPSA